jgi:hypothetical protein
MQYKVLIPLFLAATALAAPAPDATGTSSSYETSNDYDNNDSYDYDDIYDYGDSYGLADVPNSILTVMATAIPFSFYDDMLNPASRSAIISAAAAGTYPAWYNELPSSVKAWATSNFVDGALGASATATGSASETGSSAVAASNTASQTASQTASSAVKTTSGSSSASAPSNSASSSDVSSSSASASASPLHSTGGAPAPTGGVTMGVAGAAGVLALALAL